MIKLNFITKEENLEKMRQKEFQLQIPKHLLRI